MRLRRTFGRKVDSRYDYAGNDDRSIDSLFRRFDDAIFKQLRVKDWDELRYLFDDFHDAICGMRDETRHTLRRQCKPKRASR